MRTFPFAFATLNEDCMHVTSEEGDFKFRTVPSNLIEDDEGLNSAVCGLYVISEPDKVVEIVVKNYDVSCVSGGLMGVSGTHWHHIHLLILLKFS